MSSYIFDIETDDLLNDLTTIHCIVAKNIETGEVIRGNSQTPYGVESIMHVLEDADLLVGHNIVRFDVKAIQKLYPNWKPRGIIRDTQVCAQLMWPVDVLKPRDMARAARGKFPKQLMGRQSLEAWGHRIGEYKGKKVSFEQWSQELEDYCVQDVEVTLVLWQRICAMNYSPFAIELEHEVAEILFEQEQNGVPFDDEKAQKLYASFVQIRLDIEKELETLFDPWLAADGKPVTPKRDNKKKGIVAGCPYQKLKLVTFNPGSRDHIANRLMAVRGWKPTEYTDDGRVKVDEAIISKLPYPETKKLSRYLLVQKRIGQLAEGKEALIKHSKNGKIHGRVIGNGTVTGRGTHSKPNLGQVPKVKKGKDGVLYGEAGGWGYEFRSLFYAPPGWKMVGADASGLELRMLGHYMARWDGGAYAKEVVEGDVHTLHMNILANVVVVSRDNGKTWTYAYLYGAGDPKLGLILKKGPKTGAASRAMFLNKLPALKYLLDAVKSKHRSQKFVVGFDKRILHTRSEHAALNTLLQGAGAIACKVWLTILHRALKARGFVNGKDYMQVLWIHDEVQILARPEIADEIGTIAVEAVRETGRRLGLKVPLDGEYKVGENWALTH